MWLNVRSLDGTLITTKPRPPEERPSRSSGYSSLKVMTPPLYDETTLLMSAGVACSMTGASYTSATSPWTMLYMPLLMSNTCTALPRRLFAFSRYASTDMAVMELNPMRVNTVPLPTVSASGCLTWSSSPAGLFWSTVLVMSLSDLVLAAFAIALSPYAV